MMVEFYLFALFSGCITGLVVAFLGVGGGIVLVPLLKLYMSRQGYDADILMQVVIFHSLAIMGISTCYVLFYIRKIITCIFNS